MKKLIIPSLSLLFCLPISAQADGFGDLLKQAAKTMEETQAAMPLPQNTANQTEVKSISSAKDTSFLNSLSQGDMSDGLKQALQQGTQLAVDSLGQNGGFMNNDQFKIQLPSSLKAVEKVLRKVGQGKYADEFVSTMNKAAEQAVPEAAAIFSKVIENMSMQDAKQVLAGYDNAATQYFQDNSQTDLIAKMRPVIKKAMDSTGATAAYKKLMAASSGGSAGGLLGSLIPKEQQDIDQYVTDQSINALFTRIAEEEKRIRANPIARSTDLLQKVFAF